MLTSAATIMALVVLCGLLLIWGRRGHQQARDCRKALGEARNDVRRAQQSCDQWYAKAVQLKEIVDRVEG